MDGMAGLYLYRGAGDQIQIGPGGHTGRDGGVENRGLVVDRDKALVAARKRDRIRAVIPPVIDVGPGDQMPETHHVLDRRIAVLADPLAGGGGLEARGARDGQRPAARVGWRSQR